MQKDELIAFLKHAIILEEKSIPIYTRHLDSGIFWIKLPAEKAEEIKRAMEHLARDSARHKDMLQGVLKGLEGVV